jgi:hypothetical protein
MVVSDLFPFSPRQLIKQAYKRLIVGSGLSAVALSDIYMKMPCETLIAKVKPLPGIAMFPLLRLQQSD